jgi:hypothetical protein
MLDIGREFTAVGHNETAKKALEYALTTRASHQGAKHARKVQEFLLQNTKVIEMSEK